MSSKTPSPLSPESRLTPELLDAYERMVDDKASLTPSQGKFLIGEIRALLAAPSSSDADAGGEP